MWRNDVKYTLGEITKHTPATRYAFQTFEFDLQWTYNGKEYLEHWRSLTSHQRNQIDEAYIADQ